MERTAYHEAGHAVIIWRNGESVEYLFIREKPDTKGNRGGAGLSVFDDFDCLASLPPSWTLKYRCYSMVCAILAGEAAAAHHNGVPLDYFCQNWVQFCCDKDDLLTVEPWLKLAGYPPSASIEPFWRATWNVLAHWRTWRAVKGLADELVKKGRLERQEVAYLLQAFKAPRPAYGRAWDALKK